MREDITTDVDIFLPKVSSRSLLFFRYSPNPGIMSTPSTYTNSALPSSASRLLLLFRHVLHLLSCPVLTLSFVDSLDGRGCEVDLRVLFEERFISHVFNRGSAPFYFCLNAEYSFFPSVSVFWVRVSSDWGALLLLDQDLAEMLFLDRIMSGEFICRFRILFPEKNSQALPVLVSSVFLNP